MTSPPPPPLVPKPGIPKAWIIGGLLGCAGLASMAVGAVIVAALLMRSPGQSAGAAQPNETEVEQVRPDDSFGSGSPASGRESVAGSRTFAVGDKVEIEASNHWVPCVVAENEPEAVMRVRCEEYPSLSRAEGLYTVDRDNPTAVRHATGKIGEIPAPPPPKREVLAPAGLKVGEYACYGSGGRAMAGLAFKVLSDHRYSDLEDDNHGSFAISGTAVSFRGGHLDGQTGRDLRGHSFTIGSQAECEPY